MNEKAQMIKKLVNNGGVWSLTEFDCTGETHGERAK